MTTAEVGLNEALIATYRHACILNHILIVAELEIDEGSVGVAGWISRVGLDCTTIAFKSAAVLALSIELIAAHAIYVACVLPVQLLCQQVV